MHDHLAQVQRTLQLPDLKGVRTGGLFLCILFLPRLLQSVNCQSASTFPIQLGDILKCVQWFLFP